MKAICVHEVGPPEVMKLEEVPDPKPLREPQYHCKIFEKTCVISAAEDHLQTIKTYLINGVHKQGMNLETHVTALADGANNCWWLLSAIKPNCQKLECILDWFYIGKKFQNLKTALGEAFETLLDSAKWKLWHGEANDH